MIANTKENAIATAIRAIEAEKANTKIDYHCCWAEDITKLLVRLTSENLI